MKRMMKEESEKKEPKREQAREAKMSPKALASYEKAEMGKMKKKGK